MDMRTEYDFLGFVEIPGDALYGIHSVRARDNFPDITLFHKEWYKSVGLVKQACYRTYRKFKIAAVAQSSVNIVDTKFIDDHILDALEESSKEVSQGHHFDQFVVPAIQGGAGTSINMNVNEIIANRALQIAGREPGEYQAIDPVEQANVFQSTNDVIPTALKITVLQLLGDLEEQINLFRQTVEELEKAHRDTLRVGYTQMQEAVPTSYGRLFSTYAEALSRDWWRVSKCFERIKTVNLGGGAIGSGMAIPRFFIMEVVQELQRLSNLPVTRGENLQDATCNLDALVEVHGIVKAHAINLEKMVSDIRLLSSDIAGSKEIQLPEKQVGSSIMPGKINPVIPEFVIGVSHKVYANDMLIASLCAQGCLELNAYLPVIGHAMIESLTLLIAANKTAKENLFAGLQVNSEKSIHRVLHSPSITTALNHIIGYHKAAELAAEMKRTGCSVFEANQMLLLVNEEKLTQLLKPQNLLKLGFSLNDF